ncbi:FHA domain-containing protein [Protaetiibacter larvae]|uniref:FHA domain-containing protein n=1 Tax=Protaetiibacter larvae TaxID=2592654 RepID=UPI00143E0924|nr:FHA domain-containing protein [Protaetiibacter larvae]
MERRSRTRWRLELDGGIEFPLTATTVVLGRNPASGDPDIQDIAVPDATRTLSKVHARLRRDGEEWTVTDLKSTNGVVVVADDGTETELEPGASVAVTGEFFLGEVGMRIVAVR